MACGGVLPQPSSARLEACRNLKSAYPLCPDDHGADRPGGLTPVAPTPRRTLSKLGSRPATHLLRGLDGDIRVHDDTIVVTYYNADNVALLRRHYEDLPAKLQEQGINPAIPWLYDFKLDFRFK